MFSIRIANDDMAFSAGHFITLEGGQCERLHGHSYRVAAELSGPLDENQYVIDFVAARNLLKKILLELDHRMLLPTRHPNIHVTASPKEVEVAFADRRWVFPAGDCLLLALENTTTELLARFIGQRFHMELKARFGEELEIDRIRIELNEGTGFSAICDHRIAESH